MIAAALAAMMILPAAAGEWTEGKVVFVRPDETPLWRTATNANMRLEWLFPKGVESADLTVSGNGYLKTYPDITDEFMEIAFPEPVDAVRENVYTLTLKFDNGESRSATIGVVRGAGTGGEFIGTACVTSASRWSWIRSRAVLPVPYGTTSLVLNGEQVDTGLGGAAGWYAWGPLAAESVAGGAQLEKDGTVYEALFRYRMSGFLLHVK